MSDLNLFSWHDSVLEKLEYSNDQVRITVRLNSEIRTIAISKSKSVKIDMDEDWGPSKSINSLVFDDQSITIEMQSGTEIAITDIEQYFLE